VNPFIISNFLLSFKNSLKLFLSKQSLIYSIFISSLFPVIFL
jgi:hypothetical protein